jgi:hypothetical protein
LGSNPSGTLGAIGEQSIGAGLKSKKPRETNKTANAKARKKGLKWTSKRAPKSWAKVRQKRHPKRRAPDRLSARTVLHKRSPHAVFRKTVQKPTRNRRKPNETSHLRHEHQPKRGSENEAKNHPKIDGQSSPRSTTKRPYMGPRALRPLSINRH